MADLRVYGPKDSEVAFPLGGIGTGCVSLTSTGRLTDWEIFNRPDKGNELPYSFFAVSCRADGFKKGRLLEAKPPAPHAGWNGLPPGRLAGLARFETSRLVGRYPVAELELVDAGVPLAVKLRAYNPFVPLDPEASGLPVAVFEYEFKNELERDLDLDVAATLPTPAAASSATAFPDKVLAEAGPAERLRTKQAAGLCFNVESPPVDGAGDGQLGVAVVGDREVSSCLAWPGNSPVGAARRFWNRFAQTGQLPTSDAGEQVGVASVAVHDRLAGGNKIRLRFLVGWYFPTRRLCWDDPLIERCQEAPRVKNSYGARFDDLADVLDHTGGKLDFLREKTLQFTDTFYNSSLPDFVLEQVGANLATLRSPTCFRLAGGSFLAYEGCGQTHGAGGGNCTHVWNYAQSLVYFFPSLEKEMLRLELEESLTEAGRLQFRTPLPTGDEMRREAGDRRPAPDAQFGLIGRLYRYWQLTGDRDFASRVWPAARRAVDYGIERWDAGESGLLSGRQQNTYDVEFLGRNSFLSSWYLCGLKALVELGELLEQPVDRYRKIFEQGCEKFEQLFHEAEYYVQEPAREARPDQYGTGCLADQVVGQWFARTAGLGDFLPAGRQKQALRAVFENNFGPVADFEAEPGRCFALPDESGLLNCTWPAATRPANSFDYSGEVWTGVEYQVASHLALLGCREPAQKILRAVYDRYDGARRNPWAQFEYGYHYARATSSWAVYTALSGFEFEQDELKINPPGDREQFSCFWIDAGAWGRYESSDESETYRIYGRREPESDEP